LLSVVVSDDEPIKKAAMQPFCFWWPAIRNDSDKTQRAKFGSAKYTPDQQKVLFEVSSGKAGEVQRPMQYLVRRLYPD